MTDNPEVAMHDDATRDEIFLGRQPILDRAGHLVAYELLFRSNSEDEARILTHSGATATVIKRAFMDLGLESVLGERLGFINFGAELIFAELIELLPHDKIVVELLETVEVSPRLVERVRHLARLGFKFALDDYIGNEATYASLLPHVDIIKVDTAGLESARLESITRHLKPYGKRLLAEKIETREQADECRALGYDLFQGYFFAKPMVISGPRLTSADTAVIKLTGLVATGADNAAIEATFRENPHLSINLLRIVNSAAMRSRQRITSLRHALLVIGTSHLNRWLQILMYSMAGDATTEFPSPLTILAATRGKLMEEVGHSAYGEVTDFPERAFMTGIFSLAGVLFGRPLDEILAPLPLADDIKQALLHGTGELGKVLTLAKALEAEDGGRIAAALSALPKLDRLAVNPMYVEAMAWAESLGRPAT